MTTIVPPKLLRLAGSGLAVADPEEDIRGSTVLDEEGNEIGIVEELYVDEGERHVRLLELVTSGHSVLGARTSLVPVDAVAGVAGVNVTIDASLETLADAPAHDPVPTLENPEIGSVYGHFGFGPYWGADYRRPRFPHF